LVVAVGRSASVRVGSVRFHDHEALSVTIADKASGSWKDRRWSAGLP
jgi:hypothetical protein